MSYGGQKNLHQRSFEIKLEAHKILKSVMTLNKCQFVSCDDNDDGDDVCDEARVGILTKTVVEKRELFLSFSAVLETCVSMLCTRLVAQQTSRRHGSRFTHHTFTLRKDF